LNKKGDEIVAKYGKPMTWAKRLANAMTLNCSDGRVGIVVLTTSRRAVSISLTTKGTLAGREVIVGTASNHAAQPKLVHVTTEITKDVLVLREASWFDEADADAPHVGETFTKETAAADFPTIVPFLKSDDDATEYAVGSYPASHLFGAKDGETVGPNGKSVDEVQGQCEEHSMDLSHWYEAMCGFNKQAHDALVAAATAMKTHLPKCKPRGVAYASNGLVVVTRLSDDDEDGDLHAASAAILLACETTAAANIKLAAEIAAENAFNATAIPRSVRRGLDSGSGDDDGTLTTCTAAGGTSAKQMMSARLLIVHSNETGGVHYGPKVSEEGEEILECSERKHQSTLFNEHLLLREDQVSTSGSAASSRVSVPQLHKLQVAQFLQGDLRTNPLTSLEQAMLAGGFSIAYLLPRGSLDAAPTAEDPRHAEELLGEDPRRMSRMDTKYESATRVNGVEGVTIFLANCMAFFSVIPETDVAVLADEGEGRKPPFLFEVAEAIFAEVTTLPFRRRAAEVRTSAPHLALAIVHKVDVMCAMVFKGAKLSKNSRTVTKDDWSKVSGCVTGARAMLQRTVAELREFAEGGRTPDEVALWTNSAAKKAMEATAVRAEDAKAQKALAKMAADLGRSRRGRDDDNPRAPKAPRQPPSTFAPADRSGDIICSLPFTERMLLPRITKEDDKPCAAWYRDGSVCKRAKCTHSHCPIDDLCAESQKEWIRHVKATKSLIFNPKRVKSAACSISNMRPAAAAAAVGAAAGGNAADG
jgi:hypothetical protein